MWLAFHWVMNWQLGHDDWLVVTALLHLDRLSATHQPAKWQNQIKRHTHSHYCASPWRSWISRWILYWVPDVNWQGNNSRGIIPLYWKFHVYRCADLGAKQNASKWVGGKIWLIKIQVQSPCREESKRFAFLKRWYVKYQIIVLLRH